MVGEVGFDVGWSVAIVGFDVVGYPVGKSVGGSVTVAVGKAVGLFVGDGDMVGAGVASVYSLQMHCKSSKVFV